MKRKLYQELKNHSKINPLNRYSEAKRLGVTERTVRELIGDLRMDGVRVCADSSGKGYWIAESEKDYKRFRAEYISRASSIFSTVFAMDGVVEGQIGGMV